MADTKFSLFTDGGDSQVGDTIAGLRGGTNYRFSFPGSGVKDSSGNYLFKYVAAGAASVNYVSFTNAATGNAPIAASAGADANIDFILEAKGTGIVNALNNFTVGSSQSVSSIINDGTMATATANNLSTSLAVKTYANSVAGSTTVTDDTTTNATMYPIWVTTTSGSLPTYVSSSKMTFNPSTGSFTTTSLLATDLTLGATTTINAILDEDDMSSDSATAVPTQQSSKAYADNLPGILAQQYFNSIILETADVTVTSDGATITLELDKSPTGNLTILTSAGKATFIGGATIALTAGTDVTPVLNYVYIPQSTGVLTVSTSSWPSAEHAAVATVLCQSATSAQTDGLFKVHVWSDHIKSGSIENGHSSEINYWIRQQNATWTSGVSLTATPAAGGGAGAAGVFTIATTSGVILQLHQHAYPAFDTSAASHVYVPNDSVTAFDRVTDLATLLTDANGVTMSNKRFNLVIWGSVSQDTGDCQLFVNLPTASYNSDQNVIDDVDRTSVYTIPATFKGTGFLISRLSMRHVNSGNTWETLQNEDLRNLVPAVATGSGTGGITAVEEDPTPVLGGNLDGNTFDISNANNMDINASGSYGVAGTDILSDSAGTMTLSNVDALDATTAATIAASIGQGFVWNEETGTSATMVVNNGYIANNAGLVTLTLPDTAAIGSRLKIQGKGAGGWRIAQNAGETIHFGSVDTTTGVGGYLEFTNRYDSIELVCITANTDWAVLTAPQGNITHV